MIFTAGLDRAKNNPISWSIFVDDHRLFDALVTKTWPKHVLEDALVAAVSLASSTYFATELLRNHSFQDATEAFSVALLKKNSELAFCIFNHVVSASADSETVRWVVHCDNINSFQVLVMCQPESVLRNDIFIYSLLSEARKIEKWMLFNARRWDPEPSALDALLIHHREGLFESSAFLDCVKITRRSLDLAENAGKRERRLVGNFLARQRWKKLRHLLHAFSLYPLFLKRYYSPTGQGFKKSQVHFHSIVNTLPLQK
jgi:hypothetical protein